MPPPVLSLVRSVGADLRAARHGPSCRTARPEVGPYRREGPARKRKVFAWQLRWIQHLEPSLPIAAREGLSRSFHFFFAGRGWEPHLRKLRDGCGKTSTPLPGVRHLAAPSGWDAGGEKVKRGQGFLEWRMPNAQYIRADSVLRQLGQLGTTFSRCAAQPGGGWGSGRPARGGRKRGAAGSRTSGSGAMVVQKVPRQCHYPHPEGRAEARPSPGGAQGEVAMKRQNRRNRYGGQKRVGEGDGAGAGVEGSRVER